MSVENDATYADASDVRQSLVAALKANQLVVLECRALRATDLSKSLTVTAATDGSLRAALQRGGFFSTRV